MSPLGPPYVGLRNCSNRLLPDNRDLADRTITALSCASTRSLTLFPFIISYVIITSCSHLLNVIESERRPMPEIREIGIKCSP